MGWVQSPWFPSPLGSRRLDRVSFCGPLLAMGECPGSLEALALYLWLGHLGAGGDRLKMNKDVFRV